MRLTGQRTRAGRFPWVHATIGEIANGIVVTKAHIVVHNRALGGAGWVEHRVLTRCHVGRAEAVVVLTVRRAQEGRNAGVPGRQARVALSTFLKAEVKGVVLVGLLHLGQNQHAPRHTIVAPGTPALRRRYSHRTRRENAERAFIVVNSQADLLQVVHTLGTAGSFTSRLDGGQKQRDQDGDDGNHDKKFDQGEA